MKNVITKNIFNILLVVISFSFLACDNNIPTRESLAPDYSYSIADFTASKEVIQLGESVDISWEIEDPEGKVDYVLISDDVGTVAKKGTQRVTPEQSTTYYLTVYPVDGGATKTDSVQITVVTASGDVIEEAPEAEVCNDSKDNDFDDAVDCDDEDCAQDEACFVPETVYAYDLRPAAPSTVYLNEPVTIEWESNYKFVLVIKDGVEDDVREGTGSFTFTPVTEITKLTFEAYDDNGGRKEVDVISVNAQKRVVETPEFSAKILKFAVEPSNHLITGQPYTVSWQVEDASSTKMDEISNHSSTGEEFIAGDYTSHTLSVTDLQGVKDSRTIDLVISEFSSLTPFSSASVTKIEKSSNKEDHFLITDKEVTISKSNLSEAPTSVATIESLTTAKDYKFTVKKISSVADIDENLFIGTDQGVFYKEKGSETAKQILLTYNTSSYKDLAVIANNRILGGKNNGLVEIVKSDSSSTGYTTKPVSLPVSGQVEILDIIVNPLSKKKIIVITGEDGVFLSTDNAGSFLQFLTGKHISGGYCSNNGACSVWNQDEVYILQDNNFIRSDELSLGQSTEAINFVLKEDANWFVATTASIYSFNSQQDDNAYLVLDGHNFRFLVESSNKFSGKSGERFYEKGKVTAITNVGQKTTLEWVHRSSWRLE